MEGKIAKFVTLCLSGAVVLVLYSSMMPTKKLIPVKEALKKNYLVFTPGCTIPQLDPYDESIRKFVNEVPDLQCHKALHSLTVQDGRWLRINQSQMDTVNSTFGHCSFRVITRKPNTDGDFTLSKPIKFEKDFEVPHEYISVSCFDKDGRIMYKNYHAFILPKNISAENKTVYTADSEQPSVVFVGVDSISQLNMIRQLKRTRQFLTQALGSVEYYGYNKVADNTFVNIVPLLADKFIAEVPFDETTMRDRFLDDIGFLWKNFSSAGYTTLLAEDAPDIGTFNYLKAGFRQPPTDYYLRPFSLAMQRDKSIRNTNGYCVVDRPETRIVLDYMYDFLFQNRNKPVFAYAFLSKISHDYINEVGKSDYLYLKFFQKLREKNLLENTILFFFSDHGIRFGGLRNTYIGKMEERLPMMIIYLPPSFKSSYPQATRNIQLNARRLTTPFDIYYTLRDILSENFEESADRPHSERGFSLFTEVSTNRTCESAAIAPHWCTCQSQVELFVNETIVNRIAMFAVDHINRIINNTVCAVLELKAINRAWRSVMNAAVLKHNHNLLDKEQSVTDYQVMLTSMPGDGQFEATVRHVESNDLLILTGDISRINLYGDQSYCVHDTKLKKYCYCSVQI